METESTKKTCGHTMVSPNDVVKESTDKIEVINNTVKLENIVKENIVKSNENDIKMTNNLAKHGEPLLSPGLNR